MTVSADLVFKGSCSRHTSWEGWELGEAAADFSDSDRERLQVGQSKEQLGQTM